MNAMSARVRMPPTRSTTNDGGGRQTITGAESFGEFVKLGSIATNVIPGRLRADVNVHLDLNARVTVDGAQGYPVHVVAMCPAERRTASAAEAEAHPVSRLEPGHLILALSPGE
jgi:hypothetical protein